MPKRSSIPPEVADVQPITDAQAIARQLGRLGGLKGGPARAARLTAERRSDIAKRAAEARWKRA